MGEAARRTPERTRHLAIHDRHLVAANAFDRPFMTVELLKQLRLAGTADERRAPLAEFEWLGVTEVTYQHAGPDIPRELRSFGEMARGLRPSL